MSTLNARSYSGVKNLNLKGQGTSRGGILRFEGTNSTNPLSSTSNGLYVNASNQLIFSSQGTSTTLGAAGGGSTQPSFEALYNNDQTMSIASTTFTIDRTAGDGNVLTLTNSGAGAGHVVQITNVGTGKDINGTSDTWSISKAGDAVFNTVSFAGDADSTGFTLTAGDFVMSDGKMAITNADNEDTLAILNNGLTSASALDIQGSGTFTGSTTSSFIHVSPSGLTTGTALYLVANALTTGKAIHVVGNAVSSGILVHIASSVASTTLTTTGRLFMVDHSGAASGTGTVAEFATAAADETDLLLLTASAGITGDVLRIAASSLATGTAINAGDLDALTTGIGLSLASTSATVTTGSLIRVSTGTTGAVATNGIVSIRGTGAHTSTSNVGLLDVQSSGATGTATIVNIKSTAAAQTDTTLLNVEASGFTTGYTGMMVRIKSVTTTGTGTVLGVIADGITSGGTAADISVDALTTGLGLNIANSGGAMTTGSLLRVTAQGTGAIATNGIVSFTHTGAFTSNSAVDGGFVEVKANDTTAGTVFNLVADALTTGIGMQLSNGTSGMTSGSLLRVTASGTGTVATNGIVSITHGGIFVSTSNAGVLDVRASAMVGTASNGTLVNFMTTAAAQVDTTVLNVENSGFTTGYTGSMLRVKTPSTTGACKVIDVIADGITSGGTVMNISVAALTTGDALVISNGTSAITSGSLIKVSAGGTGAIATDGIVSLNHAGIYTSASNAGFVNITANATTAGTVLAVNATGLVDGIGIYSPSAEAGLTTGKYMSLGGVFTVAKYGATVITGTAAGTNALTLTTGDLRLTSGHAILTSGNLTLTSGNLVITSGNLTLTGKMIFAATETIAAGGTTTALDLAKVVHYIDADAGGDTFTLADGIAGQITTILLTSSTGVATITPTNLAGGTSVTLNADGDSVVLQFMDTEWFILGGNSYTVI